MLCVGSAYGQKRTSVLRKLFNGHLFAVQPACVVPGGRNADRVRLPGVAEKLWNDAKKKATKR